MTFVTFSVQVEGRPPFLTHSVLLARAYTDLHTNATTETIETGRNWPVPRDPEYATHRAVRRAALAWKEMERAVRKFEIEVQVLVTGPRPLPHLAAWLAESRAILRDEVYALNAQSAA